ncbi:MAG: hypothetical protein D6785_06490, partial [Planctomycetota bacterium]
EMIEKVRMGSLHLESFEKIRKLPKKRSSPKSSTMLRRIQHHGADKDGPSPKTWFLPMGIAFLGILLLGMMVYILNSPSTIQGGPKNEPLQTDIGKNVEDSAYVFEKNIEDFWKKILKTLAQNQGELFFQQNKLAAQLKKWNTEFQKQKKTFQAFGDGRLEKTMLQRMQKKIGKTEFLLARIHGLIEKREEFLERVQHRWPSLLASSSNISWFQPYHLILQELKGLSRDLKGTELAFPYLSEWLQIREKRSFQNFHNFFINLNIGANILPSKEKEDFQKELINAYFQPSDELLISPWWTDNFKPKFRKYLYFQALLGLKFISHPTFPDTLEGYEKRKFWEENILKTPNKQLIPWGAQKVLFFYFQKKKQLSQSVSALIKGSKRLGKFLEDNQKKPKFLAQVIEDLKLIFQVQKMPAPLEKATQDFLDLLEKSLPKRKPKNIQHPPKDTHIKQIQRLSSAKLTPEEKQGFMLVQRLYFQKKVKEARQHLKKLEFIVRSRQGKVFYQYFQNYFIIYNALCKDIVLGDLEWWTLRSILESLVEKKSVSLLFPVLTENSNPSQLFSQLASFTKYIPFNPSFLKWMEEFPKFAKEFGFFYTMMISEYFRQNHFYNFAIEILKKYLLQKTPFFELHKKILQYRLELYRISLIYKNPSSLLEFSEEEKRELQKGFDFFLSPGMKEILQIIEKRINRGRGKWMKSFFGNIPVKTWLFRIILFPVHYSFPKKRGDFWMKELDYFLVVPLRAHVCFYYFLQRVRRFLEKLKNYPKSQEALK